MAFSTSAQLRTNVPRITVVVMPDVDVDERIADADKIVRVDLGNIIDFTLVIDTPAGCSNYINKLSQYKTAERSLVAKQSAKRMMEEITDWQYWQDEYKILLESILAGEVDLGAVALGGTVFTNSHREGIEPALGQGEEGEYLDDDDIESSRSEYGKQYDD